MLSLVEDEKRFRVPLVGLQCMSVVFPVHTH